MPVTGILLICVVVTVFFRDAIIKKIITEAGESVFAAKVEMDSLDTTLKDMSIEIKNISIADKNNLWKNLIECENMKFSMLPVPLLSGKIIIETAQWTGVKWNTARNTSGTLPPKKLKKIQKRKKVSDDGIADRIAASLKAKASQEISDIAILSDLKNIKSTIKEIDVKQIMDQADLSSLKEIENLKSSLEEKERKYTDSISSLNIDDNLKKITSAVSGLKELEIKSLEDIASAKKQIEMLKDASKSAEALRSGITEIKNSAVLDFADEKDILKKLTAAKDADYQDIMSRLKLGDLSAGNITKSLLGQVWIDRFNTVVNYIGLTRKYMPKSEKNKVVKKRFKGMDVAFEKRGELPGFLAKKISVSGTTGGQGKDNGKKIDFSGYIYDITSNPVLWGRPATVEITGVDAQKSLKIKMLFDHTKEVARDEISFYLAGLTPGQIGMDNIGNLLFLKKGDIFINGGLSLTGNDISASAKIDISKISFDWSAGGGDKDRIMEQIFAGTQKIDILISVSGVSSDLDFKVKSNLDDIFKSGIQSLVGAQIAELKNKINAEINKKIDAKKKELIDLSAQKKDRVMGMVSEKEKLVADKVNEIRSKANSYEEKIKQKEQELKQQGQQKLEKQLKGIFKKK